jgi:hypothetical protein
MGYDRIWEMVPSALNEALQAPRSVGTNEKPDVSCDRDVSSDAVSADCADAMSCSICSVVYSGKKWMHRAAWNRWVTTMERDQPHKTPVTSTWTADFLTREGEGRKAVGDWLRDKTISWKARRR